jgi:hypothetical protein
LGILSPGKSFEAGCERLEPQERKKRVFKGQPDIDILLTDNNIVHYIISCNNSGIRGYGGTKILSLHG